MNKQTSPTKGKEAPKTEKQQQAQSPTKVDKPAAPNKTGSQLIIFAKSFLIKSFL